MYRRTGIAYSAYIVEEMETESEAADRFTVVQVEIEISDFRLAETILHRPVHHSIPAGRCDIELIPTAQRRRIAEREALEEAAAVANIYLEASQREAQEQAVEAFSKAGVKVQPLTFEQYAAWLEVAKESAWKNYRAVSPRASELLDTMLKSFIDSGKR